MVGRLVQEEDVDRAQHERGEGDSRLFAAAEVPDPSFLRGAAREAERAEHASSGELRDCRIRGSGHRQHVRQRRRVDRELLREVLREVTHARALAVRQRAALQPKVTAERSKQRGLARAVGPDDEPAIAAAHLDRSVRDERLEPRAVPDHRVVQDESLLGAVGRVGETERDALGVPGARTEFFPPPRRLFQFLQIF